MEAVVSILVAHVMLRRSHRYPAFNGTVLAAWFVGMQSVAVASIRAVCVNCVARLLVAVLGIHVVCWTAVIPKLALHATAISSSLGSSDRSSTSIAVVAVTAILSAVKVTAGLRVSVVVGAATVVAASPAGVAAHDLALVGAHGS